MNWMNREPLVYRKVTIQQYRIARYTYLTSLGVLLTHGNLAMAVQSNLYGYAFGPEERVNLLSYLPLAHIYEVCCWLSFDHFPKESGRSEVTSWLSSLLGVP
jgi:hypothetical protein